MKITTGKAKKKERAHCSTCGAELPPGHPMRTGLRKNDGTKVQIFRNVSRRGK